ncbi:GSCOCG00004250001-RA-CDS [Cotesia congregata]|nr:GSCOCG00004250001-RA-CDS [Cotesia congregata]
MHSPKAVKAPDKSELEILHTNKLEQLGWSNQEYKNVPEPKLHHLLGLDGLTSGLGHRPWWDENTVDRHEESKGIVVQVPLNQQIIVQQPKEEEKVNPLVAFFRKLKSIKNSIFSHHLDKKVEDEEEHKDHKISTVFVYTHPSKHGHYP